MKLGSCLNVWPDVWEQRRASPNGFIYAESPAPFRRAAVRLLTCFPVHLMPTFFSLRREEVMVMVGDSQLTDRTAVQNSRPVIPIYFGAGPGN